MENTRENHPESTKIKIISNFVLNSCFPTDNIGQSGISSPNNEAEVINPTKLQNILEEANSSDTIEYEMDQIIEYDIPSENVNKTANEQTLYNKQKATDSEYEETVEFNYLTGAYERVKRIKQSSTTLVKENEVTEITQQNNKSTHIYKCFDCHFTAHHYVDFMCHVKNHLDSCFVCPNHQISTENCSECIYAKCINNLKVQKRGRFKTIPFENLKNPPKKREYVKFLPKIKTMKDQTQKYKYSCFHCDFKISSKELLKYHALKLHCEQSFSCTVHLGKEKKCKKCVYQHILSNLKEDLRICANCGFKTCREATFNRHRNKCRYKVIIGEKESSDNNYDNLSDSEEEYSPFKHGRISSKINRKIVPDKVDSQTLSNNSSDDTSIIIIDEPLLTEDNKIEDIVKEEPNIQYTNTDTDITSSFEANNYDFICYDCPFKAYMEADYLTSHAETHQQSTFTCSEHALFNIFCKRCIYQYALMSIKLKKIYCKYCPKKFEKLDSALIHMRGNCSELPNNFSGYLMCYDCGLKPTSRQELFKHVANHKSSYQCFDHEQPNLKTCSKCLYEFLVKSLYRCFKCECSRIKSEFELRSHIETKHSHNTIYPQIKCNKHSQLNDCCRQCAMKQICDDVYLQKLCPICNTRWTFLKLHISSAHKNVEFNCQTHVDKKTYGKCVQCYTEKILETREKIWNCRQCVFRCNSIEEFELHIVVCHSLETFMCPQHSLGDIQSDCDMCAYEAIALKLSQ